LLLPPLLTSRLLHLALFDNVVCCPASLPELHSAVAAGRRRDLLGRSTAVLWPEMLLLLLLLLQVL
jgi:hypothetical protein